MDEPDDGAPEQNLAEGIFAAWAVQVENGEPRAFEELLRAHPSHAQHLSKLHEDWQLFAPLLGKVVPGLIASTAGIQVAPLSDGAEDRAELPSAELLDRLGIHAPNAGRYRFRAVLGRGGGGVVLKVWDTKLNRPIAMKVVLGRGEERPSGDTPKIDSRTLSRFVDEARIASQLNHPGIVPVHELGADETGRAYFTMKLVKGEDLACVFEHVKTAHDGWNQTRALSVVLKVCEAMSFAHAKGVVHRDLKPANVMVGRYGEVHVMDWGLARVLDEKDRRDLRIRHAQRPASEIDSLRRSRGDETPNSPLITMDGAVIGTPAYMSPEQGRGELDRVGPRSDVYAIGAMLYELVAGQAPFVHPSTKVSPYAVLMRLIDGPPRPLESLAPQAPLELVAICERAMSRESNERYRDMIELAGDLRAFLEGRVVAAYESGAWAEARKWVRRNRALATSIAAACAILVVGSVTSLALARRASDRASDLERSNVALDRAKSSAEMSARSAQELAYASNIAAADSNLRTNAILEAKRRLASCPQDMRGWEWRYLDRISDTSLMVLRGHSAAVTSVAFSPDGRHIVSGSEDRTVRVWDAATGRCEFAIDKHDGQVRSVCFSPDGSRILSAAYDQTVRVWNAVGGDEILALCGHQNPQVERAVYSSDGLRIATTGWDCTLRVWDAITAKQLFTVDPSRGDTAFADSVAFSPDGTQIATGSWRNIRLWDATTGQYRSAHSGTSPLAFSPDGSLLISGADKNIQVWDTVTEQHVSTLVITRGDVSPYFGVYSIACSPDSTQVAGAYWDKCVRVWDILGGEPLFTLRGHDAPVLSVAYSPDGTMIATGSADDTVRIWRARADDVRARGEFAMISWLGVSRDGSRVLYSNYANQFGVWDLTSNERRAVHCDGDAFTNAFSHDGTRIAFRYSRPDLSGIKVILMDGESECEQFITMQDSPSCLTFSLDDMRIASGSEGSVHIWDALSGALLLECSGHTSRVTALAFSGDGARLVSASTDLTLRIWDTGTGACLHVLRGTYNPAARFTKVSLEGGSSNIDSVSFSPDGSRVVSCGYDGTIRIWKPDDGISIVMRGHDGEVMSVAYSPDGSRIISGGDDGTVRVWDAINGEHLLALRGRNDFACSLAFTPDGSRIVAVDGEDIRIWDAAPR